MFQKAKTCKDGRRNKCKDCRNADARNRHTIICEHCGKEGKAERKTARYCSNECKNAGNKNGKYLPCSYCKRKVYRTPYYIKNFKYRYCSDECQNKHKAIILKGENNPKYSRVTKECDGCGKKLKIYPSVLNSQKYHFCSKECCNKHIGEYFRGPNHPRFNPGLTLHERLVNRDYFEYNKWREKVYERDNYTCQCCGDNKGGNLVAHHILNFSEHKELRTVVSNGMTLCKTCHKNFHDTYGYSNNNSEQLQSFISEHNKTPIPL